MTEQQRAEVGGPRTDTTDPEICALCGQKARGLATITLAGGGREHVVRRYCHEGESPTCYEQAQAAIALHGGWARKVTHYG